MLLVGLLAASPSLLQRPEPPANAALDGRLRAFLRRLSAWETRAGWRLLFDGVDASSWGAAARVVDGGLVAPADEAQLLVFAEPLADFELELVHATSRDPAAAPAHLRAVARAGTLEVWDGTLHFEPLEVPARSRVSLGPVAVERDTETARWTLGLHASQGHDTFRDVRLRALDALPDTRAPLFDGKTLAGWRAVGDARWTVEDGCIVGAVGGGKQSFLVTEREYGDFVLDVDLKNDLPGNSGLQVRSHQDAQGRVFGYQIEVDPSARAWSGGLYDEGRRGWLADLSKDPLARAAFRPGQWSHYRIECAGPHVRTWVNGTRCVDALDPLDAEGFIALQVHAGKDTQVRWRNFELRSLGTSAWAPLALAELGVNDAPVAPPGGDARRFASADEVGDFVLHVRRASPEPHAFTLAFRAPDRAPVRSSPLASFASASATLLPDAWRLPLPGAERAGAPNATTLPEDLWIVAAGTRVQILSGHRVVLDVDEPRGPARGHVLLDASRKDGGSASDVSVEIRTCPER